jgi:tRNA modification GTPase
MQEHAMRALEEADHIVFVYEFGDFRPLPPLPGLKVLSKAEALGVTLDNVCPPWIAVSAFTGQGMEKLRAELDKLCFGDSFATASLSLNARHMQAIEEARESLARASEQVHAGAEFIAVELRQALDALGQISGQISPDDLLGRVFSAFCIGK